MWHSSEMMVVAVALSSVESETPGLNFQTLYLVFYRDKETVFYII